LRVRDHGRVFRGRSENNLGEISVDGRRRPYRIQPIVVATPEPCTLIRMVGPNRPGINAAVTRKRILSKRAIVKRIALALLLAIAQACSQTNGGANENSEQITVTQPPAGGQLPGADAAAPGGASMTVIQGRIVSVNQENKFATLQAAGGTQLILHVLHQDILAAAKPGEPFIARFYEIVSVHKLVPGQLPSARSLRAGIVNAVPDQTPGVPFGSQYQFAVTVYAIDKNDKTISITGLDGRVEVVVVANPESLDQIQVGEQIVVTLIDVVE
jgi:hypothetical protein